MIPMMADYADDGAAAKWSPLPPDSLTKDGLLMDPDMFDQLARTMTHTLSRRHVGAGPAGVALLALAGHSSSDAKRKHKKYKKHKKHQKKDPVTCTLDCRGKTCGDDGCGGSCGDCFRGTCSAGICTCPVGYELCQGGCLVACSPAEQRNPETCGCCMGSPSSLPCTVDGQCCSGACNGTTCRGRNGLEACTFDGQCQSSDCRDGVCTCDGTVCNGVCGPTCSPTRASQNPVTCECCVNNGIESPCGGSSCDCCCSGQCTAGIPRACLGLPTGASCTFAAQCASGSCHLVPAGGDFYVYQCA